jgi:nucleotide-binding universal stress UspA family protein/hemerythrin-like domain-containing protein
MYSHLMVPVDDSSLSAANVDAAARLAHVLGARISFFHATADLAATEDGDLLRMIAPAEFNEAAQGATHAVLARAAASASALGVPCETLSRTCDRPAEAIVEAAQSRACDLIVMASRGVRHGIAGWLHSSQTERVLRQSPIALLVTRVAANNPPTPSERALAVILDEHRSIAAVLRGMRDLVEPEADDASALDLASLGTMLAYVQAFPIKLHHPKEEEFLHRLMRLRAPACASLLAQLEAQHAQEYALVEGVQEGLRSARAGDAGAMPRLRERVRALADAVWQHLSLEERELLPLARQHLQDVDWVEMAVAFESNNDPGFGEMPANEFRRMFTRIANLLPASVRELT